MLQVFPQADLVVGVLAESMRGYNAVTKRARETWLARLPGARRHHRWFLPLEAAAFATLDTRDYGLVISSSHAFSKAVRTGPRTVHVCYCYSPPRYLWDLNDVYRADATWTQSLALGVGTGLLRFVDRRSARGVDEFIGISRCVAARIERAYGRGASVVYPPVTPKPRWERNNGVNGDFLLSLGRLVPYKRVDLAIQAAERVGVRLLVAGDGPDRARLERLGGRWTEFVGEVSEEEAGRLLSTCAAFVFCGEEDFGMAPVEANSSGTPVVGFARGGLLETMVPGETAELFTRQDLECIVAAIRRALERDWDRTTIRHNAERFEPVRFRDAFAGSVEHALRSRQGGAACEIVRLGEVE